MSAYLPSRPVDRDKAETELSQNIKKATNQEETAPKQKHVRSTSRPMAKQSFTRIDLPTSYTLLTTLHSFGRLKPHSPLGAIVYTWDYHNSASVWNSLKVQPILSDEVQTFKALITVHKIIRGGHPVVCN